MAKITLSERDRAAISFRLNGVSVTDHNARRAVDRMFDSLKLDELPGDSLVRINDARPQNWAEGTVTYDLTSEQRDRLIEWLSPSQAAPLAGFLARILGAISDTLIAARDGLKAVPPDDNDDKGESA